LFLDKFGGKIMGFLSRLPSSNDLRGSIFDDTAKLLNGGKRCCDCKKVFPAELLVRDDKGFYCSHCFKKKGE